MAAKRRESADGLKADLVAAHNEIERLKAEVNAANDAREKAERMAAIEQGKLTGAIELMAAKELNINGVTFPGDANVAVVLMDERIPVPDLAHAIARGFVLRRGASQTMD